MTRRRFPLLKTPLTDVMVQVFLRLRQEEISFFFFLSSHDNSLSLQTKLVPYFSHRRCMFPLFFLLVWRGPTSLRDI